MTKESIEQFVDGKITLAQLYGISVEQAYAIAEIGFNLFEQGKLEEAQKIYEGLVAANPFDGYFHSVLGSIYTRLGDIDQAHKAYAKALELEPVDPHVYVARAELYLHEGRLEEAMNDLKRIIDNDPLSKGPFVGRAKALVSALDQSA